MTWGNINIWLHMEKVWREDGNLLFLWSFLGSQNSHSWILTHTHTLSPYHKNWLWIIYKWKLSLVGSNSNWTSLKEQLSVSLGSPIVFSSHRVVGYMSQMVSLLLFQWMINWNLRMAGLIKHDHLICPVFPPSWRMTGMFEKRRK